MTKTKLSDRAYDRIVATESAARAMLAALRSLHKWASHQEGWDATEWRDVPAAIAAAKAAGIKAEGK